jgi:hypothetical protein
MKDESSNDPVDYVRFRMRIVDLISKDAGAELLTLLPMISDMLSYNHGFLSEDEIIDLIWIAIQSDRLTTLQFGKSLLEGRARRVDDEACKLVNALLYPTVFDVNAFEIVSGTYKDFKSFSSDAAVKSFPEIKKIIRSMKQAMLMINLEM